MPAQPPKQWKIFRDWLSEPLGQLFINTETNIVTKLIKKLFGYHAILLGDSNFVLAFKNSPILHRIWISPHIFVRMDISALAARQDKLPLLSDEIELAYVAHSLEFLANPHEVLREVYRVLKPEGHVVISGFNPWSFWGLWRWTLHYINRVPWDGHFISLYRLKDWLALLGFDVIESHNCFFRPPLAKISWMQKLRWIEILGRWCWPFWGACYIVLARKRVMTLTPVIKPIKTRRKAMVPGLAEPAARQRIE